MRKPIIFFLLALLLVSVACSTTDTNSKQAIQPPAPTALYNTVAQLDSSFFAAFNTKNFEKLKSLIAEDLEFYHDLGGVTNYQQNLEAFKRTFVTDRKLRRELVRSTLEVYPIKDYGAVETGVHRFYATEKGQEEKLSSEAKFVQLWRNTDGAWKITRIISYGHEEYLK